MASLVTIDIEDLAARVLRLLMGENVEDRRRFIEDNAVNVKNLGV